MLSHAFIENHFIPFQSQAPLRYQTIDDSAWVAKKAARIIQRKIEENNRLGKPTVLGLATGSTPLPLYQELIRLHQEEGLDFSRVITFNLDEYQGLPPSHPQSYHYFMHEHFFKHVNMDPHHIHLLDGTLKDPVAIQNHLQAYEKEIAIVGGIDIQILGLGGNGHIAFNEPGSAFHSRTRLLGLDAKTRADNARFFSNPSEVPTQALSMGIGTILEAKQILLLATGSQKAGIVEKILQAPTPTEAIPATALFRHQKTLLLLDRYAAKNILLNNRNQRAPLFAQQPLNNSPCAATGVQMNFARPRL